MEPLCRYFPGLRAPQSLLKLCKCVAAAAWGKYIYIYVQYQCQHLTWTKIAGWKTTFCSDDFNNAMPATHHAIPDKHRWQVETNRLPCSILSTKRQQFIVATASHQKQFIAYNECLYTINFNEKFSLYRKPMKGVCVCAINGPITRPLKNKDLMC